MPPGLPGIPHLIFRNPATNNQNRKPIITIHLSSVSRYPHSVTSPVRVCDFPKFTPIYFTVSFGKLVAPLVTPTRITHPVSILGAHIHSTLHPLMFTVPRILSYFNNELPWSLAKHWWGRNNVRTRPKPIRLDLRRAAAPLRSDQKRPLFGFAVSLYRVSYTSEDLFVTRRTFFSKLSKLYVAV